MTSTRKQHGRHRLERRNISERMKTKRILSATAIALAAGGGLQMVNATASYAAATPNDYHIQPGSNGLVNVHFAPGTTDEEMHAMEMAALNANGAVFDDTGMLLGDRGEPLMETSNVNGVPQLVPNGNVNSTPMRRPGSHDIVQFAAPDQESQITVEGVGSLNHQGRGDNGQMSPDGTMRLWHGAFPSMDSVDQRYASMTSGGRGIIQNGVPVTEGMYRQDAVNGQISVATHELGHGLGLDHPATARPDEVMANHHTIFVDQNGNRIGNPNTEATTYSGDELALINATYQPGGQPSGNNQSSYGASSGPGYQPQAQPQPQPVWPQPQAQPQPSISGYNPLTHEFRWNWG